MSSSRTISFKDRDLNPATVLDPSSAQLQVWLAQMKRDHGDISGKEMSKVETACQPLARKARTIMNPYTGEIRRIDADGNLIAPGIL